MPQNGRQSGMRVQVITIGLATDVGAGVHHRGCR